MYVVLLYSHGYYLIYIGDRLSHRRSPLILGSIALFGSVFLLLYGTQLWIFAIGRVLQGIADACIWTFGFCLIVDTFPANALGAQVYCIYITFIFFFLNYMLCLKVKHILCIMLTLYYYRWVKYWYFILLDYRVEHPLEVLFSLISFILKQKSNFTFL